MKFNEKNGGNFFPFQSLRKSPLSSWIFLKFLFLRNSINIPHIAYQSIQNRKLYSPSFRLRGLKLKAQLLHWKNWGSEPILKEEVLSPIIKPLIYQATLQDLKTQKNFDHLKLWKRREKKFELNVSNLQGKKFSSGKRTGEFLRKRKMSGNKKAYRTRWPAWYICLANTAHHHKMEAIFFG